MAKTKSKARARLSRAEQLELYAELESLAHRSDQIADRKSRRKLRTKPKASRKTKRRPKKTPKPKRRSAKAIGSKYQSPFLTKEISHDFIPPLVVRHNSDVFKVSNKIFALVSTWVRITQKRSRFFQFQFRYRRKGQRRSHFISFVVREVRSKLELYEEIVTTVESMLARFLEYQMRNQNIRISQMVLKEYRELPKEI